jgi:hypothetical protein
MYFGLKKIDLILPYRFTKIELKSYPSKMSKANPLKQNDN